MTTSKLNKQSQFIMIKHDQLTLSNVEFTTTNLCNMRCSHCAVGYTLQTKIRSITYESYLSTFR